MTQAVFYNALQSFDEMMKSWDVHCPESPRPSAELISPEATLLAEIGVHKGWNAKVLLGLCPKANIVLVDDLQLDYPTLKVLDGGALNSLQRDQWIFRLGVELAPVYDRMQYWFEDSLTAVKHFEDGIFDYVYLDNTRDAEQIAEQMRQWFPKVKTGGILAGSGIDCVGHEGIDKALADVFKGNYVSQAPDWWVVK